MTVEQVGTELMCSATKISRLETGARRASLRDVRDLCRIYSVTDSSEASGLMELAKQAREPGWWDQYKDMQEGFRKYIGYEQDAVAVTSFSMYYVSPLLQTEDYARAIISGLGRKKDPQLVKQTAEARLRRQRRLEREPRLRYRALMDEAVLHRQVGGPAVMRAQLEKLLRHCAEETASIQVIPFDVGAHAGADSNFDLLEFGESTSVGPIVYLEGLYGSSYFERPAEIEVYRDAINRLRDVALNIRDTAAMITRLRQSYPAT